MNWYKTTLEISTQGKGLHDITETVRTQLREWGVQEGMCYLFIPHTSASLVMSENWDPTARADLETFMQRLVPERDSWYTHDLEGPDDATSHIRSMLTDTSFLRNPHYHRSSDTPDTLDYDAMAQVALGVAGAMKRLLR